MGSFKSRFIQIKENNKNPLYMIMWSLGRQHNRTRKWCPQKPPVEKDMAEHRSSSYLQEVIEETRNYPTAVHKVSEADWRQTGYI